MFPLSQGGAYLPSASAPDKGKRMKKRYKALPTTHTTMTREEAKARRKVMNRGTDYGKMTTSVHESGCGVWDGSECGCDSSSVVTAKGRVPRRTRAGEKKYRYLRKAVMRRDGWRCRYCGIKAKAIEVDHVQPWSKGGRDSMENLVTACRSCNQRKFNSTDWMPTPLDAL